MPPRCRTCGFTHTETDCPRWPARDTTPLDLDRFTTPELAAMHTGHCNAAGEHWAHAKDLTMASIAIPYGDQAAYDANVAANRAAMAAGDEQFELAKAIGAELNRRAAVHA